MVFYVPSDTPFSTDTLDTDGALISLTRALQIGLFAGLTVLVAVAGPFSTYDEGRFGIRFVYWLVTNAVALGVALSVKSQVERYLAARPPLIRELCTVSLTTLVFTPFLDWWTHFWFQGLAQHSHHLWQFGRDVFVICLVISAFRNGLPFLFRNSSQSGEAIPMPQVAEPRLVRRLPGVSGADVLRVSADGHVVQVVTRDGLHELRMRFADAVEEMDTVDGKCAHRSHWVSRAAIAGVETRAGRPVLMLVNGDAVPVSRKYQPMLEEDGYL